LEVLKKIIDKLVDEKKIEALTSDFDRYLYLKDIKDRISKLKQEGINNEKFTKVIEKQRQEYEEDLAEIKPTLKKYETTKEKQANHIKKLEELNIFFEEYKLYLRENSLYDFNDMINFALEKFETDRDLRLFYAEIFQFIMLDEYQDTNNAQNRIIELILSESDDNSSSDFLPSLNEGGSEERAGGSFREHSNSKINNLQSLDNRKIIGSKPDNDTL
jgi:DNA helicase-2/ATP-dependent DNA helicase PcrA